MESIVNTDDVFKEFLKQEKELEKIVYIEGNNIIINAAYKYQVSITTCDTPEKLIAWTFHLTEKTWMNTKIIRHFIGLAARHSSISLDL